MEMQSPNESDRLSEAVKLELMNNDLLMDDNLVVEVDGDEIVLSGDVDTRDKKWLAEDIANSVFGVLHVRNEIEVVEDLAPEATRRTSSERHFGIDAGLS